MVVLPHLAITPRSKNNTLNRLADRYLHPPVVREQRCWSIASALHRGDEVGSLALGYCRTLSMSWERRGKGSRYEGVTTELVSQASTGYTARSATVICHHIT